MTGALYGVETASICGMSRVLWSFLMVAMVGLGSFWMGNLPPCTLAAALKADQTHLVRETFIFILDTIECATEYVTEFSVQSFHLHVHSQMKTLRLTD